MLSIFDGNRALSRRKLLTIGGLGIGGLSLPSLLAARAAAGDEVADHISGKSVVFLFQQGGPSQHETFDPKTEGPLGVRTVTGTTKTALPGVMFGDTLSQLAELADKFTVVRSFQTKNAGHNIQPIVGPDSLETNIGVHYARVAGSTRPENGMPTNAVLYPAAVADNVPKPQARGNLAETGGYGSGYAPFVPGGRGQLQQDMQLSLPKDRFFNDRRALLEKLDGLKRGFETAETQAMDKIREQAYQLLLGGGVSKAMDLSLEDRKTLELYDTAGYAKKGRWNKVNRGKKGYYHGNASSIGKLLLMSRRLCEAGCGFVTIHAGYAGVWDMHADGNNLNMVDGMNAVGRSFDHAVAAFIRDVEARGLQDRILLVCCGEMGRTPKINRRGGRDHWSRLAPLMLYGGGIKKGQVIGRSTRNGGEPETENLTPQHLIATIMHTLFDVGRLRLLSGIPSPVLKLAEADPIPGLV